MYGAVFSTIPTAASPSAAIFTTTAMAVKLDDVNVHGLLLDYGRKLEEPRANTGRVLTERLYGLPGD